MSEPSQQPQSCPQCGKPLGAEGTLGVCPKCLLGNQLLNTSEHRTMDFGTKPLIDMPDKDVTVDSSGRPKYVEPLQSGQSIGDFEIVRRLGRGGMGTVYEAQDSVNQRRVALKVLSRPAENAEARERFLREGRLAASINHPNSVFVFGTHQVDGLSLISMELVNGGTLEQRIRRQGPMSSRKAVDAALQIIDGLEAAHSLGVLHRDIKPANCFIADNDVVKVGDYGLSISTDPQFDARLTGDGGFLGTPAFSSPEQLRGDTIDIRSDIYALGVTLYQLLTGTTPFKADGMVKLMAKVLENSAEPPCAIRPDIPTDLSRVVMRCLSKEPGDRYRNYSELRVALMPFSSELPEPASLGWRTTAGLIDLAMIYTCGFLYTAISMLPSEVVMGPAYSPHPATLLLFVALRVFYYGLCEAFFGQTIGKRVFGLRTVDPKGNLPSFRHSMIRAAMFVLFPLVIVVPYNLFIGPSQSFEIATRAELLSFLCLLAAGASSWILFCVLFSTARRQNGLAGMHDLLSDTRVVSREYETRVAVEHKSVAALDTSGRSTVGPYHVLEKLNTADGVEMLVGYDTVMLRRVWLRNDEVAMRSEKLHVAQGRSTRLRWLNCVSHNDKNWNVYEAPTGRPLLNILDELPEWKSIKHWLSDISNELTTATHEDSLPQELGPETIWINESGHAKLLGFAAPELTNAHAAAPFAVHSDDKANHLLVELANLSRDALVRKGVVLPPPASVLSTLEEVNVELDLAVNCQAIRAVTDRRDVSPKRRRLMMTIACYAVSLSVLLSFCASLLYSDFFYRNNRDVVELIAVAMLADKYESSNVLSRSGSGNLEQVTNANPELAEHLATEDSRYMKNSAAHVLLAAEHAELKDDPRLLTLPVMMRFHKHLREHFEQVAGTPTPSEREIAAAKETLADEILDIESSFVANSSFELFRAGFGMSVNSWLFYVGLPGAIAGLFFRGGLVLLCFQATVVRMNGTPASRFTMFVRSLIPVLPAIPAMVFTFAPNLAIQPQEPHSVFGYVAIVVVFTLVGVSNFTGKRSLPDRLLGTAVVSK